MAKSTPQIMPTTFPATASRDEVMFSCGAVVWEAVLKLLEMLVGTMGEDDKIGGGIEDGLEVLEELVCLVALCCELVEDRPSDDDVDPLLGM